MKENGHRNCNVDHCCYFRRSGSSYIIFLLYADDMLVVTLDIDEIDKLKKQLFCGDEGFGCNKKDTYRG